MHTVSIQTLSIHGILFKLDDSKFFLTWESLISGIRMAEPEISGQYKAIADAAKKFADGCLSGMPATPPVIRRGPGRPPGSKNRPKDVGGK